MANLQDSNGNFFLREITQFANERTCLTGQIIYICTTIHGHFVPCSTGFQFFLTSVSLSTEVSVIVVELV